MGRIVYPALLEKFDVTDNDRSMKVITINNDGAFTFSLKPFILLSQFQVLGMYDVTGPIRLCEVHVNESPDTVTVVHAGCTVCKSKEPFNTETVEVDFLRHGDKWTTIDYLCSAVREKQDGPIEESLDGIVEKTITCETIGIAPPLMYIQEGKVTMEISLCYGDDNLVMDVLRKTMEKCVISGPKNFICVGK